MQIENKDNLERYLIEKGLVEEGDGHESTYCSGGVSGTVVFVERPGKTPLILKQALEFLKTKETWPCHPDRIVVEYNSNNIYHDIVPDCAQKMLFCDTDNWIAVREAVPADWRMWKKDLLRGILDFRIAKRSIEALLTVHEKAAGDPKVIAAFPSKDHFYKLRVDPYIVFTAGKYPELQAEADEVCRFLMEPNITLVHSDFSPKNIMIHGDLDDICILDFESSHYGNPCFDLAFFFNHMLLKSIYNPEFGNAYVDMADYMAKIYLDGVTCMDRSELEEMTVRTLFFMLMARVDGKSPAEYLVGDDEKQQKVRDLAYAIRSSGTKKFREALALARK